jgi:hypothetical protein
MALPYEQGKAFIRTPDRYPHDAFGAATGGRTIPHSGIDVTPARKGDTSAFILSVNGGIVREQGWDKEAGNYVIIEENDGGFWGYGHNSKNLVPAGTRVKAGQRIANFGMTGGAKGVHCHIWRAKTLAAARRIVHGYVNLKKSLTTKAWADGMGLTDPLPYIQKASSASPSKPTPAPTPTPTPTQPAPPVKTPEQIEEEELMAAKDDIINALKAHIDVVSQSRTRADTRGYVFLDLGANGTNSLHHATHAVLIGSAGMMVLHPPITNGMGQINSLLSAAANGINDYRWLDSQRWAAPMGTGRFINRVKDSLTYFDPTGKIWTVEDAWAWIAEREEDLAKQS